MIVRTARDFGALIKDARAKAGMSQSELARRLKTTQGWVSEVENGKPTAEIGRVLKAIFTLGIQLDARAAVQAPSARPSITDALRRAQSSRARVDVAASQDEEA
jgi:ribosome-binding protein aMBF1 (putative translation factor)